MILKIIINLWRFVFILDVLVFFYMDNKYYTSPDEALAKAEFAYEEQKKVLDRLKTIKKDYLSKIEKAEKELENKKTNLNNIRAKIAERDGKNSDF